MRKYTEIESISNTHRALREGTLWPNEIIGEPQITRNFPKTAQKWNFQITGSSYPAMFSPNVEQLLRKKTTGLMAGICPIGAGVLRAVQKVNGQEYAIDIAQEIPKEILASSKASFSEWMKAGNFDPEGGVPKLKLRGKWKFKGVTEPGITLGKVMKIFRYFEIARAAKKPITFVLPTVEYSITAEENARLLGIRPAQVRETMVKVGEDYADLIKAVNREFFSDVKAEVLATHEHRLNSQLERAANSKEFRRTLASTPGSYIDVWSRTRGKEKEEARFAAIFTKLPSKPAVWLLNARDMDTMFPYSVKVFGNLQSNEARKIGIIGVPGGPAVRKWDSRSQKYDLLRYAHKEAAVDDYFGRYPFQTANLNENRNLTDDEILRDSEGRPTAGYYLDNLGPYFGIKKASGMEKEQFAQLLKNVQLALIGKAGRVGKG